MTRPPRADARLGWLLLPSLPLLVLLGFYWRWGAAEHFALHTLFGWDAALVGMLWHSLTYGDRGSAASRWDGVWPPLLAVYALGPDFLYRAGIPHRDWMDLFLFHIALDEILPVAVPLLAILWVPLVVNYVRFRRR